MSVEIPVKRKKNLSLKKKHKNADAVLVTWEDSAATMALKEPKNDPCLSLNENGMEAESLSCHAEIYPIKALEDDNSTLTKFEPSQPETAAKGDNSSCPMCNKDLTGTTRLQKLAHANHCLDATGSSFESNHKDDFNLDSSTRDDFSFCFLCGKDTSAYNHQRREQHTNRCLDEIVMEQHIIEVSKRTAERHRVANTYGNASIPSRYDVQICPCCNENWNGRKLTLRSKVLHMRACANRKGISVQELGRRLQWSGWGLVVRSSSTLVIEESIPQDTITVPTQPLKSNKKVKARSNSFVLCASGDDDDFDVSTPILATPVRKKQKPSSRSKRRDEEDENLQLAITLSASMVMPSKKRSSKASRKFTEADRNSSSVLSIEESRQTVLKNLENLLCTPRVTPIKEAAFPTTLPASKLATNCKLLRSNHENECWPELWTMASSNNIQDQTHTTPLLESFLNIKQ
ncbi:5'-flap endonuclease [Umbelopsis nana]